MYWFLDDPARLNQERAAIDELRKTALWLTGVAWRLDGNRVAVDADIEAHGSEYRVTMSYPVMFPATPPSVKPSDSSEPRWSSHQYVNGELCLELGADTWLRTYTGADMLASAHRLFAIEDPHGAGDREPAIAPSRHRLTAGQTLRSEPFRFVSTANLRAYVKTLPPGIADATLRSNLRQEKSYTLFVAEIQSGENVWTDTQLPGALTKVTIEEIACVVNVDAWDATWRPRTIDELLSHVDVDLREPLRARLAERAASYLLLIDREHALHLVDMPTEKWAAGEIPEIASREDLGNARTGSTNAPLDAKIGIVGLGSAGSKIAISLARSGLRKFVLVDDDILLPENLVRNDLDWRNVGEHKVDAVKNRLCLIAPDIEVEVRRTRVLGQESNSASASTLEMLAECAVIIDATADPAVFNVLGAVAQTAQRTLVWLEVFGGGFGGLVARYRPSIDPEPAYMRRGLHVFCENTTDPPRSVIGYGEIGEDDEIYVATDAEVSVIADHAARFAYDSVLRTEPSCFPYAMYLIGLRRAWIFDAPFRTFPIDLNNVIVPARSPESAEDRDAGIALVRKLLEAATE